MTDWSLFWRIWREQYDRCRQARDDLLTAVLTATVVAQSTTRELSR